MKEGSISRLNDTVLEVYNSKDRSLKYIEIEPSGRIASYLYSDTIGKPYFIKLYAPEYSIFDVVVNDLSIGKDRFLTYGLVREYANDTFLVRTYFKGKHLSGHGHIGTDVEYYGNHRVKSISTRTKYDKRDTVVTYTFSEDGIISN